MKSKWGLVCSLVGFTFLLARDSTYGDILHADNIKNVNDVQTITDITLRFTGGNLTENSTVKVNAITGMPPTEGPELASQNVGSGDVRNVITIPGFTGGATVPFNGRVTVRYQGPEGVRLDRPTSAFTSNGVETGGSVATVGTSPNLFFEFNPTTQQTFAFVEFTNPESFPVLYSNISLFINNDIANFNIDEFDMPTGELVAGFPTTITLNPEESSGLLPLGEIDPSKYVLALVEAAATSDPEDSFSHNVAATVVPEPSTLTLVGVATLGGLFYGRRRRKRAAQAAA